MGGKIETILILVVIILILFGSKKIPELARNLGMSVKEVKKGFNGDTSDSGKTDSAKKTDEE